jgi:hypothetical protein
MFEAYPDGADQYVGDDEWIALAAAENWIALTKDDEIRRSHSGALTKSSLRVFALNNANLTGAEMGARYTEHLHRIIRRAAMPGPYVYVVTASGLELRWAPSRSVIHWEQTAPARDSPAPFPSPAVGRI